MHSFQSCLMHCVFSTKGRIPALTAEIRGRLWPYLGGIARDHGMKALAIGGVAGVHPRTGRTSPQADVPRGN
jgi:hypothetical protein